MAESSPDPGTDSEQFLRLIAGVLPSLGLWARLRLEGALRHRLEPEDLVQETCVRAFVSFHNYSASKGSFRSWVFGVANHTLLRELREMQRRRPEAARELDTSQHGPELDALTASLTSITSVAVRNEQLTALAAEVEGLDEIDRWILVYRGLEELPFAEVAARVSMHPEAVRTRWRRVLEQLRYSDGLVPFLDE